MKKIIVRLFALLLILVAVFLFWMHTMEIDDFYGDLQYLYIKAKDGDILVNKTTSEFGVIQKDWRRIHVTVKGKGEVDLYKWVYINNVKSKTGIYRPIGAKGDLENINFVEIEKKITNSELKLIYEE